MPRAGLPRVCIAHLENEGCDCERIIIGERFNRIRSTAVMFLNLRRRSMFFLQNDVFVSIEYHVAQLKINLLKLFYFC